MLNSVATEAMNSNLEVVYHNLDLLGEPWPKSDFNLLLNLQCSLLPVVCDLVDQVANIYLDFLLAWWCPIQHSGPGNKNVEVTTRQNYGADHALEFLSHGRVVSD